MGVFCMKVPDMQILLPEKNNLRFALLGSGYHLCAFAEMLVERGYPNPIIVTHPRAEHERDRSLLRDVRLYTFLFDVADQLGLDVVESPTVNRSDVVELLLQRRCMAAFSLSCRSIIKKEFIDAFNGRVFNIHPSYLPEERGGGIFSWRIMNGVSDVAATIHVVDEGIDTGPVILQKRVDVGVATPAPYDFLIKTNELYTELLLSFLAMIEQSSAVSCYAQDESISTYLPRLFTEVNAAINWDWSAEEIERFVRAFSYPYPGAFSYVRGIRIAILAAEFLSNARTYHPFISGRVIKIGQDGSVYVVSRGGLLRIMKVAIEGHQHMPANVIRITDTFLTPHDLLFESRSRTVNVKEIVKTVYKK